VAENTGTSLQSKIIAAVVVIISVFTLYGVNNTINALELRVGEVEDDIEQLEEIELQIEEIQRQVAEIVAVRQDILEAVCIANATDARDAQRCRDVSR
jgi:hypothetical protein